MAVLATSSRVRVDGDEPHYLIIAASVLRDFDFDVRNNYRYDGIAGEIYPAALQPHALMPTGGPQHMPGLGILLAVPFGLGGIIGARVALALLLTPILGVAVYRWSRTALDPADATLATLGVLACSPVMFGASQLYPDLLGGVAIFALASWLWRTGPHTRALPGASTGSSRDSCVGSTSSTSRPRRCSRRWELAGCGTTGFDVPP